MLSTIQNEYLELTVDSMGAQMMELNSKKGTEFLWDGDPRYWSDRALNLFPYVGRLTNKTYRLNGKTYSMDIHGFANSSEFSVEGQGEDWIQYRLESSEETLKQYPFEFEFLIRYALKGWTAEVTFTVNNRSNGRMPFGLGGHPGFKVPMEPGTAFSDYSLVFSHPCEPDRIIYTPECFLAGRDERFVLEEGRILHLYHEMFDEDAIVLKNMAREVTLKSDRTGKAVTVSYPQMSYLGLWHMPKTDAPYICIEPWTSVSARHGVVEDLDCQSDLVHLGEGESYKNQWSITVRDE